MKKLLIVSLGVCMLGTACSRDTNRIEENTLQQSQEQSVILQTETEEFDIPATKESSLEQEVLLALEEPSETAGLSEAEYMEEPTEASEERIEQLLKQAETERDNAQKSIDKKKNEINSIYQKIASSQKQISKIESSMSTLTDNLSRVLPEHMSEELERWTR